MKRRKFNPPGEILVEQKESTTSQEEMPIKEKIHIPHIFSSFKNVLYDYLNKPESHARDILINKDEFLVIKDAYPKASLHWLLIPKKEFLNSLEVTHLKKNNLNALIFIKEFIDELIGEIIAYHSSKETNFNLLSPEIKIMLSELKTNKIKVGFHVIPSLRPLHIHIISEDYISDSLKTKKHWNSFTTAYFLPLNKTIEILSEDQEIGKTFNPEAMKPLLNIPLICNQCAVECKSIPLLKNHLEEHVRRSTPISNS